MQGTSEIRIAELLKIGDGNSARVQDTEGTIVPGDRVNIKANLK